MRRDYREMGKKREGVLEKSLKEKGEEMDAQGRIDIT